LHPDLLARIFIVVRNLVTNHHSYFLLNLYFIYVKQSK